MKTGFLVALAALSTFAFGQFSIDQPVDLTNSAIAAGSDTFSSNGTAGSQTTVADDFSITVDPFTIYAIETVTVYGFATSGLAQVPLTALTSVELNIFTNNSGVPSMSPFASVSMLPTDARISTSLAGNNSGFDIYKIDIDLSATPINLSNGGDYWLNFGGDNGAFGTTFAWAYTNGTNGNAFSTAKTSGGWSDWTQSNSSDLAWEINGSTEAVPEPATLSLIALAAFLKRRKAKKQNA